jgi:hypothetical protein
MAILRVVVKNEDGKVLSPARVNLIDLVTLKDESRPAPDGRAAFEVDLGRSYRVMATTNWFSSGPIQWPEGKIDKSESEVNVIVSETRFYLHVDANRDGRVDDDHRGIDDWRWGDGRDRKGAIVLYNVDDDDRRGRLNFDANDRKVNFGGDDLDIAPLEIRRHGSGPASPDWRRYLRVTQGEGKIRIFNGRVAGAIEVVGRRTGRHLVPDIANLVRLELGMEALSYADKDWDGYATIELVVETDNPVTGDPDSYSSRAEVRVAPWIMPCHGHQVNTVYMTDTGQQSNREALRSIGGFVHKEGLTFYDHICPGDRWMQDCMEIGYSVLPRSPVHHRMESVIRAHRNQDLRDFPRTLRGPEWGYHDPGQDSPQQSNTFDSHGNLECTPPVRDSAKKCYPWGRIYYGPGTPSSPFNPDVERFLERQVVQGPFWLPTSWLQVGHVDEILTFLPFPHADPWKRWKLLIASPKLAYELLEKANGDDRDSVMLRGRDLYLKYPPSRNGQDYPMESLVREFLNGSTCVPDPSDPTRRLSSRELRDFNIRYVQNDRLAAVLRTLEDEIDLKAGDVIEVPVIFMPSNIARTECSALTADMVNMLVLNEVCLVPKPYGPVVRGIDYFEENLRRKFTESGLDNTLRPHFIDDWYSYHEGHGEIHCGTNTWRVPSDLKRWSAESARWWEFNP